MAIDFPDNPTQGQVFNVDNKSWTWDGTTWKNSSLREFNRIISITAPNNPLEGDEWLNISTGRLYTYYDSFWIEIGAAVQGADGGFDSTQTIDNQLGSYAISSGDAGKLLTNNSGALTVTIDNVLSLGQQIDFLQTSASQITFAAGSGVTLNSKDGNLKTAAQYSPASVKCISSGVYVLLGDLGD